MQITLKLKSMEPVKSDQRLAFTYLVSSQELGDLELKVLVPIRPDLNAAEEEARKTVDEFAGALRAACQKTPLAVASHIRPHP